MYFIQPISNIIGALLLVLVSACSTTLKIPPTIENKYAVYLIEYSTWGHHSLAFYNNEIFTEFTYGDWELFALNKRDIWTAWKNMTFFTQGALGRKSFTLNPGVPVCNQLSGCQKVVRFEAPSDKVKILYQKLQNAYDSRIETEILNTVEGVKFVKYEKPYWGFHNCNHELVEWLELLGVTVTGNIFYKPQMIKGMQPRKNPIQFLP